MQETLIRGTGAALSFCSFRLGHGSSILGPAATSTRRLASIAEAIMNINCRKVRALNAWLRWDNE
jgi:hypothetical protein